MRQTDEVEETGKATPGVFANADVPDDLEPEKAAEKTGPERSTRSQDVKSTGVSARRLVGWSLPLLLLVAGAAMWVVSPLLAVAMFGGAVIAVAVVFVAHQMWERGTASKRDRTPRASGLPWGDSGRQPQRCRVPQRDGGRSSSSGSEIGSRRRILRHRLRPGRHEQSTASTPNTSPPGTSSSRGDGKRSSSGVKGRRWPLRRRKKDSGSSASREGSPETGKRVIRGRPRVGRSTSGGSTGSASGKGWQLGRRTKDSATGGDGGSSRPRSRWSGPHDHSGSRDNRRAAGKGSSPGNAAGRGRRHRWWRRNKNSDKTGDSITSTTSEPKPSNGTSSDPSSRPRRHWRSRHLVDDGGFFSPSPSRPKPKADALADQPKASQPRAQDKPTVKQAPGDIAVDDAGFPVMPAPEDPVDDAGFLSTPKPVARPTNSGNTSQGRSTTVTSTTDTLSTGYAHMIDKSTPVTLARTLGDAAGAARTDAARLEGRAGELRREAAGLDGKPGMRVAAEDMIREAAALEETAESRRGMAAAFDDRAAQVAARAST